MLLSDTPEYGYKQLHSVTLAWFGVVIFSDLQVPLFLQLHFFTPT
jgi:hypothetical protein